MGRITRRQLTNLLGALGLVATLAGLAFGLPILDSALPADRPVRTDQPYPVGAGVTVVLPRDAVLDVTGTRPGDTAGTALFRIGPVRYAIAVQPFDGTLDAAANRMRQRITGTPGIPGHRRPTARSPRAAASPACRAVTPRPAAAAGTPSSWPAA